MDLIKRTGFLLQNSQPNEKERSPLASVQLEIKYSYGYIFVNSGWNWHSVEFIKHREIKHIKEIIFVLGLTTFKHLSIKI